MRKVCASEVAKNFAAILSAAQKESSAIILSAMASV
jgi:hypothetical protein